MYHVSYLLFSKHCPFYRTAVGIKRYGNSTGISTGYDKLIVCHFYQEHWIVKINFLKFYLKTTGYYIYISIFEVGRGVVLTLPLLLARKCDTPLHSPLIYSVHGEGIPDLDFAISGLAVYEIEILSFLVLFSLISRVSDPDSGVFWIRIRNPDPG